jgi:hypothetical protein
MIYRISKKMLGVPLFTNLSWLSNFNVPTPFSPKEFSLTDNFALDPSNNSKDQIILFMTDSNFERNKTVIANSSHIPYLN